VKVAAAIYQNIIEGWDLEVSIAGSKQKSEAVNEKQFTVASLFAGIGGICCAFQDAGCKIEWANERDPYACKTYRNFMKNTTLIEKDIREIMNYEIPPFDILVAGFPCQPFSLAGHRKGFEDPRGKLFDEIIRILDKGPRAVFLENVGSLKSHNNGETLEYIESMIKSKGYVIKNCVMNTKDYGNLPQFRNRIYFVAFKNKTDMDNFTFPEKIELIKPLNIIIKRDIQQDSRLYYSLRNAKHYDVFESEMIKKDTVYQWRRVYVRENKSNVCPTLTANMGIGGHNVPIVRDDYGIRKLSLRECLDLQGFPESFEFPKIPDGQKYKEIGNSVSVPVVRAIAEKMICAMEKTDMGV